MVQIYECEGGSLVCYRRYTKGTHMVQVADSHLLWNAASGVWLLLKYVYGMFFCFFYLEVEIAYFLILTDKVKPEINSPSGYTS